MTDNRTTELLPCPFCGGEASKCLFYKGKYRVHCNVCDAHSGDVCDTEAEAIAAWNARAEQKVYIVETNDELLDWPCVETTCYTKKEDAIRRAESQTYTDDWRDGLRMLSDGQREALLDYMGGSREFPSWHVPNQSGGTAEASASQVPQSDENQGQVSDLVKQLETGDSDNNAVVNGTRGKLEYPGSQHARVNAGGNVTECDEGFVRAMEIENASNRLNCQSVERETPQTVENVTLKDEIRDSDVWNVAYEIYCAGGWVDNGNEPNPPTDGIWKLLDRAADIRKREVRHEAYKQGFMDATECPFCEPWHDPKPLFENHRIIVRIVVKDDMCRYVQVLHWLFGKWREWALEPINKCPICGKEA